MKTTLFCDNLTVIDYSYLDKELGVVGNSLIVNVEFIGKIDEEGILYDFSYAKKKVKEIIDEKCDHRLLVPKGTLKEDKNQIFLDFPFGNDQSLLNFRGPAQAVLELHENEVTYEGIRIFLEREIAVEMPDNIEMVKVELLEEEKKDSIFLSYSHGLKGHYGNCQRLFHGHRSTLEIYINDQRNLDLEKQFVEKYFETPAYYVLWENIFNQEEILNLLKDDDIEGCHPQIANVHFGYTSGQGEFKGSLPGKSVCIVKQESTVENLSKYFYSLVKPMVDKKDRVSVHAYEGINKGAITSD
jgi:6-pyruvoyl-tetrahydropterin synthase